MASVTFDPAVGGDGSTVSDDGNPLTTLAQGGHRTKFVPALSNAVAVAGFIVGKAGEAATSATDANAAKLAAQAAQTGAEAALDQLDDRYLGAKATDPTTDNDGNALQEGAFYWNTTSKKQRVYNGTAWIDNSFVPTAASGVSFTPAAGITATNVQAAIEQAAANPAAKLFAFQNLGGF